LPPRLLPIPPPATPRALGTGVWARPVPGGEVAGRIPDAAPERLATLGAPLGKVAVDALGTLDAERDGAGALAGRVRGAGQELPEPAGLDDHRRAAQVALLVGRAVRPPGLAERLYVVA